MSSLGAPKGWITASIDDVATSSGGSTPSKNDPSYWANGNIPWVSPKDMKTFDLRSSEDLVTENALSRLTKVPENSVLMVVRSGILARTLPVAINRIPVTVNQDMRVFVPEKTVEPKFIAWQLIANELEILNKCSKNGTTVASIEGPALSAFPLKIAPAAEQTRIVEKLEELLSDLDAGVSELKAAQRKLAQYRQSLLKAAVEGALTADWRAARSTSSRRKPGSRFSKNHLHQTRDPGLRRDDEGQETGAELLQRILSERRARWEQKQLAKFAEQGKTPPNDWQDKYLEPVTPDLTNLPSLPEGWAWASVDQLAFVVRGASPRPAGDPRFFGGEIPWITVGSLTADGSMYLESVDQFVTNAGKNASRYVEPGTLLLTNSGATLGVPKITKIGGCINDGSVALLEAEDRIKIFLYWFLRTQTEKLRALNQGAAQPNLNTDIVRNITVPLTSMSEIEEINRRLDSFISSISFQEHSLDHALTQAATQRKNILKAAFSGQLVPQDPNDEPASALLARIRAQREANADTTARKRGRKAGGAT